MASSLGLYCLPISQNLATKLIWVKLSETREGAAKKSIDLKNVYFHIWEDIDYIIIFPGHCLPFTLLKNKLISNM